MKLTMGEYLDSLRGKRVAVIGIGVSNTPLIRLLLDAGIDVTARDKSSREKLGPTAGELEKLGAKLRLGENYLDGLTEEVIFRTPGLRPDVPELERARAGGSIVTSEMEAFFRVCPCMCLGVTGSDGKTTTTTIIAQLLERAGYRVHVGGNIGKPLLAEASEMGEEDVAVLELSSFQLMTMEESPEIAVVTNLAPNHLDVHRSMEEYVDAKRNIFLHQGQGGRVILNADNEITRSFASQAKGKTLFFSRRCEVERGAFLRGDGIWVRGEGGEREVLPLSDILLPGVHNVENYMAAIAAVDGMVPDPVIRDFAKTFGGVEHRIELVRTVDGVRYYNDSIASSPSRTIAGLRSFREKVILIAGGYDKHIPFDVLGPEIIDHVKLLILTGDTAQKLRDAVEGAPGYQRGEPPIQMEENFTKAVLAARAQAQPGDTILLSPACASFDRFKNFMERGKRFKEIVESF